MILYSSSMHFSVLKSVISQPPFQHFNRQKCLLNIQGTGKSPKIWVQLKKPLWKSSAELNKNNNLSISYLNYPTEFNRVKFLSYNSIRWFKTIPDLEDISFYYILHSILFYSILLVSSLLRCSIRELLPSFMMLN